MAEAERLMTLKNISAERVSVSWDGIDYAWEPGEEKTLRYGVGLHCRDNRQAALTVVGESTGLAPETVKVEAQLVNNGKDFLSVPWDGVPYGFNPGDVVTVDESLAHPLMTNARQIIARDELDATLDRVAVEGTAVTPPEAQGEASETPAEPVKKRRTRKKKETPAE